MVLRPGQRARKAYSTGFRVLFSYLWLFVRRRLFGASYYQKRINKLHARNAERVKSRILELQGLFIKVGQFISILSYMLPDEYGRILESLQDRIPARDIKEIEKTIVKSLGKSIAEIYGSFDHTPVGTASIGQVHRATLMDGTEVVVKVRHHDIVEIAKIDLKIIKTLMRWYTAIFNMKGMDQVYSQTKLMIEEELNFTKEAASINKVKINLEGEEGIIIPETFPELCTSEILTLRYYEGAKITEKNKLEQWEIESLGLAEKITGVYAKMILKDGFYHADPHPGNLLITPEKEIVVLDFGAVGTLSESMKTGLLDFIQAVIIRDNEAVLRSLQNMGFISRGNESEKFTLKMIEAVTEFIQNEVKLESLNIKDISIEDFRSSSLNKLRKELSLKDLESAFQVPKDWILLNRTLSLLGGIINSLVPNQNPVDLLKPHIRKLAFGREGLTKLLTDTVKQQATFALALPAAISKLLRQANRGELEFHLPATSGAAKLIYLLGKQFFYLILSASAGYLVYYFDYTNQQSQYNWSLAFMCISIFFLIRSWWLGSRLYKKI